MTLDNFRTLVRAYVPGAKINVISNTVLDLIINKGVDDVNSFAKAYAGDVKFDITAEQGEYIILDDITDDYLLMDQSGVWWNSATEASPKWERLWPVTKKWLDRYHPNWREESSSDPQQYYVEQGILKIYPTPSASLTNGGWIYYLKAAQYMSLGTHYPFSGSTSEVTNLRDFDDAIIDYARWKLARPLGKMAKGVISKQDYKESRKEKTVLIKRRPDITSDRRHKIRLPRRGVYRGGKR